MPLEPGTQLGHYEICEPLGAGGMGEVYRTRDTKLGREVAIKLLLDEVSHDSERLARFEREARVLASLNHPNIATLHGFENFGGHEFLIMELVEGETLAERLTRGPMELQEAVAVFEGIAGGLRFAHDRGIVHRDLKPANVKISKTGGPKILDFGLARVSEPPRGGGDNSLSPTLTLAAGLSGPGQILGTAAYMSPEQIKGGTVDSRADIWAFGCCLWESLTGRSPFGREGVQESLAAALHDEPNWQAVRSSPNSIRRLLRRCLVKDPENRLQHIGDAALELHEDDGDAAFEASPSPPSSYRFLLPVALSLVLVGAAVGWLVGRQVATNTGDAVDTTRAIVTRTFVRLPPATTLGLWRSNPIAVPRVAFDVSQDGTMLVFAGDTDAGRRLFLRRMDLYEVTPLPGTEGGFRPLFSPDGQSVAFLTRDHLKKVSLRGGEPTVLCDAPTSYGATWADDGWIYFNHHEHFLQRISENGGEPQDIVPGKMARQPYALPRGRGLLVSTWKGTSWVTPAGELKPLLDDAYNASYSPTGHLLFARAGDLYAAVFDLEKMEVSGESIRVVEDVWSDYVWRGTQYAVSSSGTLVYVEGGDPAITVPTWIDRDGVEEPLAIEPGHYGPFELSPAQSQLAFSDLRGEDDIYLFDLAGETRRRLTLQGQDTNPVWMPDGRSVLFQSDLDGGSRVFVMPVDGTSGPEALVPEAFEDSVIETKPTSVSRDGKFVLLDNHDIWVLPLSGDAGPRPVVATEAAEIIGSFSPDGRWIAYLSDKTGRFEVFVRPFPDSDRAEWQVSSGGGDDPRWSPTGEELFFRDGTDMMSVSFTTEPDFSPEPPEFVFQTEMHNTGGFSFDVSTDGRRFLIHKSVGGAELVSRLHVVQNWFEELERLVPHG